MKSPKISIQVYSCKLLTGKLMRHMYFPVRQRHLNSKQVDFLSAATFRWMIGIAGPPGGGKSTLASAVCTRCDVETHEVLQLP